MRRPFLVSSFILSAFFAPLFPVLPSADYIAMAQAENEAQPIASIGSLIGHVIVLRGKEKISVVKGFKLFKNDQLVTSKKSVAKILFADGSNFVAFDEGSVAIEEYWTQVQGNRLTINSVFNVVKGKVRFFVKPREGGHAATVKTANSVMGVRGTSFFVDSEPESGSTKLIVTTGVVAVSNPSKPTEEILVNPNEITSITKTEKPLLPQTAATEIIAQYAATMDALPEKLADGTIAEEISLPPPSLPPTTQSIPAEVGSNKNTPTQKPTSVVVREVISPQFMVVPLNAVLSTKAGMSCNQESITKFRNAAREIDPFVETAARDLAKCRGLEGDLLFWLTFYYRAKGELGKLSSIALLFKESPIPLDEKPEREKIVESALLGDASALKNKIQKKEAGYVNDTAAQLILARSLVRDGKYSEASSIYRTLIKQKTLTGTTELELELAYVTLLEGKYDDAYVQFDKARDLLLNPEQSSSLERGLALAKRATVDSNGSELDGLRMAITSFSNADRFARQSLLLQWNTRDYGLSGNAHNYKSKTPNEIKSLRGADFQGHKTFRLSSGISADAQLGYFNAGNGIPIAGAKIEQKVPMGVRYGANVWYGPAAFSSTLSREGFEKWSEMILGAECGWREFAEMRYEAHIINSAPLFHKGTARGYIPIHRGALPGENVRLVGRGSFQAHSEASKIYYSPASETSLGIGTDATFSVTHALQTKAAFSYDLLFRKTRTAAEIDERSKSQKRQLVEQEALFSGTLGFAFHRSKALIARLDGEGTAAFDSNFKQTFNEFSALLSFEWLYNQTL